MASPCKNLEAFSDGELSASEADAFRDHLPDCAACQAGLTDLLMLERLGSRYVERYPEPPPPPPKHYRRPLFYVAGFAAAAGVMLVAGLVVANIKNTRALEPAEFAWNLDGRTRDLPRMTDPRSDRYRSPRQQAMGSEDVSASAKALPYGEFDKLDKAKDYQALAAMLMVWGKPEEALGQLDKLPGETADSLNDRAAALLASLGKANDNREKANKVLELLDRALTLAPSHSQAHWNRALLLEKLGLPLSAARDFKQVTSQDQGWVREAAQRADELIEDDKKLDKSDRDLRNLGEQLIREHRLPEGVTPSPKLRNYFYELVRTCLSAAEVQGLTPLAKSLDGFAGDEVLENYVKRVAARDFKRRAPLVQEYIQLRADSYPVMRTQRFVDELSRAGEDDLVLGVLMKLKGTSHARDTFIERVSQSQDPWLRVLAAQYQSELLDEQGDLRAALAALESAEKFCAGPRAKLYRCVEWKMDLSYTYGKLSDADNAEKEARSGWTLARDQNFRELELRFLMQLANTARMRKDVASARAFLGEALERTRGSVLQERDIHQNLAHLELSVLNFERARAEIDQVFALGIALTQHGADALVSIAPHVPSSHDEAALKVALKDDLESKGGKRAYALHLMGRFYLQKDRAKGQALLEKALQEAAHENDNDSIRARGYSSSALIIDAAKAQEFDGALERFGQAMALTVRKECVVGLAAEWGSFAAIWRGQDGRTDGFFTAEAVARTGSDLTGVLPEKAVAALKNCSKVDVLARPPLHDRSGVLPPDIAWSYRTRMDAPKPRSGRPIHLVVFDVDYGGTPRRPLHWTPTFAPGAADEEQVSLSGTRATLPKVIQEMTRATEIDIATHGEIRSKVPYLVLAKDADSQETAELTIQRLRTLKLEGAPLVILAACEASEGTPVLYEPVSLPHGFLAAGARAVIAATRKIPDGDSSLFFADLRAQLRKGSSPAVALRDTRQKWLREQGQKAGAAEWLNSILVFE